MVTNSWRDMGAKAFGRWGADFSQRGWQGQGHGPGHDPIAFVYLCISCISRVYFRIPGAKPILPRVSKSGNSLAVRIPKELAFVEGAQDIDMERVGNALVVRPVVQVTIGDLTLIRSMLSISVAHAWA